MPAPGLGPLRGRRVLAVVDGQVEVVEVDVRVAAVLTQPIEQQDRGVLERTQLRLVERVGLGRRRLAGTADCGEVPGHTGRGQVGDATVVDVEPGALPHPGEHELTQGRHPSIHGAAD